MRLHTDATRLLGIDLPILLRGPALAAAAGSEAGGFGIVVAGPGIAEIMAAIDEVRAATSRPFGILVPGAVDAALDGLLDSPASALVTCGEGHRLSARIRAAGKRHLHEPDAADVCDANPCDADPCDLGVDAVLAPFHGRMFHARVPVVATRVVTGAQLAAAMALGAAAAEMDVLPGEPAGEAVQRVAAEYAACVRALPLPSGPPPRNPDRAAREAAALRENLRRRKDQVRARTANS